VNAISIQPDGPTRAQRQDHGLRAHTVQALHPFHEIGLGQQRLAQNAFGFLLVGLHNGGPGFNAFGKAIAICIEQCVHAMVAGGFNQPGIKRCGHVRRHAATQQQPLHLGHLLGNRFGNGIQLGRIQFRPAFVELNGKALTIGDRQVRADLIAYWHQLHREAATLQKLFQQLATVATLHGDGARLAAERSNHIGCVDAPSAGGLTGGEDVRTVIVNQTIGTDDVINGRVQRERDNQAFILVTPAGQRLCSYMASAWAALLAVCFFWGTTYLGIRVALEGFRPLTLVSTRFFISGLIMLAWAVAAGQHKQRFTRKQLWIAAISGVMTLGVGNGCLVWAETWIPSSLAALFVTTAPFWLTLMDRLVVERAPVAPLAIFGMVLGFSGAVWLVLPSDGTFTFSSGLLSGFLVLQLGNFGWSSGSMVQKKYGGAVPLVLLSAIQQLAVGLVFAGPALYIDGWPEWPGPRAWAAVAYLATFGSVIGYSAYLHTLRSFPIEIASIYTYVNPLVAAVLGVIAFSEPFGLREVQAMVLIFAGVYCARRSATTRKNT
jgi:drug/metabolite transporter (DMT)-like permease